MSNMNGWIDFELQKPDCDQYLAVLSERVSGSQIQVVSRLEISNGYLTVCAGHTLRDFGVDILFWKPLSEIITGLPDDLMSE
jgi:hypothetical protein